METRYYISILSSHINIFLALRLKLSSALKSIEALRYDFKTKPSEKKQLDLVYKANRHWLIFHRLWDRLRNLCKCFRKKETLLLKSSYLT